MKYYLILILLCLITISCHNHKETIMYINNHEESCVGVAPQKCLLIKFNTVDDWQYFYNTIEGFEYESGYFYKLKIKKQSIENPPADGSSLKYILVEIIEKSQSEIE